MSFERPLKIYDQLRFKRQQLRETLPSSLKAPFVFLSPAFVLLGIFLAFPVVYTFYLSFFTFQGVATEPLFVVHLGEIYVIIPKLADLNYVGLQNYQTMLTDDVLHQALFNTVYLFLVLVPIMIIIPLGLAIVLNSAFIRFKNVFRTLLLIPTSATTVAYSVVFVAIFVEGGLASSLFALFGLNPINWLRNGFWSRNLIVIMSIWRWTGYNMIIFLAGLQTISGSLYEAAEIGGATRFQKFRYVTLPQLKPVLLFILVTSTIATFQTFGEPTILIKSGAPIEETRTIVYYIYEVAFQNLNLGYGSALTVLLVSIVTILSLIQLKVTD
jgi:ABC-type sugar transport system permease subunit